MMTLLVQHNWRGLVITLELQDQQSSRHDDAQLDSMF